MTKEAKEVKDLKEKLIERRQKVEEQLKDISSSRDEEDAALKKYVEEANKHIAEKQNLLGQLGAAILQLRASMDTMASLLEE